MVVQKPIPVWIIQTKIKMILIRRLLDVTNISSPRSNQENISILQEADAIFIEELKKEGFYDEVSQAFCVYLPVKSVGVVGDERRYADVIALRAVTTVDFMTAEWSKLSYEFLGKVSNRIVNELEGISRVVYDISGKPPATIEWE